MTAITAHQPPIPSISTFSTPTTIPPSYTPSPTRPPTRTHSSPSPFPPTHSTTSTSAIPSPTPPSRTVCPNSPRGSPSVPPPSHSPVLPITTTSAHTPLTLVHAISNQTAYEDALFTLAVPANTFNDVDVGDTLSYSAVQDGLSELPSWLSFSTSTVTFSGTPDNDDVGSYSITLTANDGNNGTPASDTFDINVLNTNDDPTLVHAISNQTAYEDALFTLAVPANTFNDVDVGDTLSYSAVQDGLSELPSWLSFSTSTVTFSGTPDNDDVGSYSITLTANDGNNGTPASDTFDINVLNTNDDPTLVHAISNQTAYEDALFTLAVPANTFNDVDVGDTLSYSAVQDGLSELPSWLSFSTSTVTFSGTPDNDDVGSYSITLTANDGNNGTPASDTFDINVLNTNDDPTLVHAISNQTAYEDALFTLAVPANTFNDVDVGDTLSYSAVQDGLSELPSWLSFSTSTVTFSGTPDNDDVGSYSITLTADDGNNGTPASDTFDINVLNTNDDPTLVHAISNQTAYEDALFTLAVPANTFNDVDVGDTLSYSAVQDGLSELPSWLSFSTSTVTFSGTPDNDDVGSYSITLTANDGNNGTPASDTFDINVLNTNDDPTLVHAISNQTAYEDALFTLAVPANTFNDVDVGDTLSYSAVQDGLSELPSWLSFSTSTVTFSGTPDNDDVGSYSITLTANDGNNGTPASDTFDINVLNTNDDPTLVHAISNQTAYEDALFTLAVPANTFNDVDVGDTLSYSAVQDGLSELPSWLSFSTSTVTFSGTPDNDDVGSYSITLTANDGNNGTPASDTFDINVLNTNDDPTLVHAISNQTAYEDALFTLAVPANTFNDVDVGDTLSYSAVQDGLSELPSWLSFSTSTVTFSGTPDNDDVGSYSITLTANDGNNGTPASDTFDINVLNTNDDPTLVHAISNQTAYEDALFTLAVPANTFNDVDVGDTLSYSAVQDGLSELPSWLSFSTSTVTFSGTPDNDDVGSYSITLTADDGNNGTPASDTFDINVLNTNDDPTLVHAISNQTAYEDALFTLAVPANTFNDVDVGDTLSYSAVQDGLSELPSWLSFSTSTVTFSGTPDNDDVGSYSITLTANDGNNGTPASDTFDINVLNTNDDPTLVHAISNQTAYEDALFTLAVPANTFNDVDVGDTLSYSAVQDGLSELPSWLSFSTSTVTFSGTPDNDDVGSYSITLTADDGNNGTPASDTFDINVLNTNDDPTLVHAISNQTAYEDALFTLAVPANTFNDVDVGDTLSYSAVQDGLSELPSWLSFSTSTVTFSGTPDNDDVGSYSITLTADDGNNGTPASDTFDINVLNTNDDPTLVHAISNQTAYEDALFTLAVPANTFNDVDVGDTLSYSAVQDGLSELPSWLSFSTSTVTFSGTPDNDDVGSYSITLTANDGNNGTPASDTFDINVLNTNDDPTLVHAISNQTAYEDALFTLAVPANTFNDVDVGDTLSYSAVQDGLSELPSWLSFSTSTVTFSGTPDNDDVGSYSITLTANDGNNGTPASDTFDINVLNTNDDPTLVHAISNQTAYEDALFTLAVPANTFNDVDVGDTLSYSAVQDGLSELPSWLSFSTSTVTFSGTPDNDDVGSYSITLTANDGNNGTPASDTFDINVLNTNDDPTLVHAISNQTAYEDALFTLAVPANTFNDVDVGDTLSYSAVQDGLSELPSWLSFSTSTVTFSGTPDNDDVGSYSITLTANDGNNGTPASDTFDINVLNTNDDPTLVHAISNQTAYEDALFTLAVPANTFNDVDVGDTLSYSAVQDGLSELPSWLSFSTSTVTFSGTPDNDDVGSYSITLTANDGNNGTPASDTFDINVLNTNDDPTLVHAISNQTAYEDALFTLAVPANTFNDVDVGDTLSYSAVQDGLSELPSWLSFSTSTVTFSGTPDNDDVGSYSITLTANDGNNGTPASDTFDINVLNTNDDPTLVHAISNQTAYEDALFTLAVPANTFNDVDVGDTLSYSAVQDGLSELPSWLSFSTSTVTFSGTPDNDDVGSYSITLTADDGNNGTPASDTFDINVLNTNDDPTLVHAISNQTAYEDALFTLAVPANTFNDVDVGDTLSYSAVQDGLSELPSWLSFSTSTVTFSGTPDNDDVGSYSITLTANDGNNGTPASDTFDINVLNTNDDPTLVHAISNQTAYEDALFTLAVPANTFNDVDVGDTLSYSAVQDGLSELPSWLSFSTSTVTFSGTPDNDDVGSYSITLTANDGNNGTPASDTFDINVLNTNDAPTLVHAISNQTAYEDALFTLAVPANTFNDVDVGDTLSYSAVQDGLSELPSWLSFSTSTVTFSGTPDNDDVGSYSITLTANDGNNGTPASDTFDINVLNTNDDPTLVHAGGLVGDGVYEGGIVVGVENVDIEGIGGWCAVIAVIGGEGNGV